VRALFRRPTSYRRISYAQEAEDLILAELLQLGEWKRPGFYVDVGAYHPTRISNTFLFYLNGWSGINIDATPGSMRAFRRKRPRDINIEAAVGEDNKALTFYEFNEPALSGFCRDRVPAGFHGWTIVRERQLATMTLAHLLEQHLPPGKLIDFMNVDVEGLALPVLKSNDWAKFRPTVILVEDDEANQFNRPGDSNVTTYLVERGYKFCCKTILTTFFIEENQIERTITGTRVRSMLANRE
jgi:FkbM family methyltransferase